MANTLLVNGTDLTRYDRTIDLESWGSFLSAVEYRGDDLVLPGMPGEVYGGRVAGAREAVLTVELTGTSAANTWPADPVAQFTTNLDTLKALTAVSATPLTLTVQPAGTTVLAVRSQLEVAPVTEFWGYVTLGFKLLDGTV